MYREEGTRKQGRESGEDTQQKVAGWKLNLRSLQDYFAVLFTIVGMANIIIINWFVIVTYNFYTKRNIKQKSKLHYSKQNCGYMSGNGSKTEEQKLLLHFFF